MITGTRSGPDSENMPYFREMSWSRAPEAVGTTKNWAENMPYFTDNFTILDTEAVRTPETQSSK